MKRKLLLEFAAYLDKLSSRRFDVRDANKCISFYACKFNGEVNSRGQLTCRDTPDSTPYLRVSGSNYGDLERIFGMSEEQATALYSQGFSWSLGYKIKPNDAALVVRRLARTGKVDYGQYADALYTRVAKAA